MPKKSDHPTAKAILAAGAVLWRYAEGSDTTEVAVVHRPRYDDWSLPKGKVDPGESEPVTAVREVEEETGYAAELGRELAPISYPVEPARVVTSSANVPLLLGHSPSPASSRHGCRCRSISDIWWSRTVWPSRGDAVQ